MKRVTPIGVQRSLVFERCRGKCEKCGKALPSVWECHHRKLRSQGGTWSLANLIALHTDCHNAGSPGSVHAEPRESYRLGYLVKSFADPIDVPIFLHGRRWVRLSPSGTYEPTRSDDLRFEGEPA